MNFREHVFVAQCNSQHTIHTRMFLRTAQTVADECCQEWGHDWISAIRGRIQRCRRCGRSLIETVSVRETPRAEPPPKQTPQVLAQENPTPTKRGQTTRLERRVFGRGIPR